MKIFYYFKRAVVFILILPFAVCLDLILYSILRTCPACSSFGQFLLSEGAISFPFIVDFMNWFGRFISRDIEIFTHEEKKHIRLKHRKTK